MEFWFEKTKKRHNIFAGFEHPQVQGSIPVATINGFLMIAYFGKIKKN